MNLVDIVRRYGGRLEEDDGYRKMAVYQVIAPDGQLWSSDDIRRLRVEIAIGRDTITSKFNELALARLENALALGTVPIPEEDLYMYDTE